MLVLLVAAALGWLALKRAHYRHQQELAETLQSLGVEVVLEPRGPWWLQNLLGRPQCEAVTVATFALNDSNSAQQALELLPELPHVETLSLQGYSVTDEHLEHLRQMPHLRDLEIKSTKVTDAGLAYVADRKLARLLITLSPITDEGLQHLQTQTALESLVVVDCYVTEPALRQLQAEHLRATAMTHDETALPPLEPDELATE